jgi:citrate synthase
MSEQRLTITDDRTGKSYELPIENGTVRAMDLRQMKTDEEDFGLMTYDPALMNTASTRSAITFIDGDSASCLTRNSWRHGPTTSRTTPSSTKISRR